MIGRPLRIEWRAGDDGESLKARYQAEKRAEVRQRLHALWLLRTGRQGRQVAEFLGIHERSIQRWVSWYREGGLASVSSHRLGGVGNPSWLSPEQQAEVVLEASLGKWQRAEEARVWIREKFGIEYKPSGIYELLSRLKCKKKAPRPVHVKASKDDQEAWKKGAWRPSSRRLG